MDDDVRYERDIYTWLTTLGISQHYFLFKSAGYEKIRDVLYATEDDILRLGLTDPMDLLRIMVGIRHVSVPDPSTVNPAYHTIFQCGRLLVEMFGYVEYKTMIRSMAVCKGWRNSLVTGVKALKIEHPERLHAPVSDIMIRFQSLTRLSGTKFGHKGVESLKRGVVGLIDKTDLGSQLRELDLSANQLTNDGTRHLCEGMQLGAMTHLEALNLSYNSVKMKGAQMLRDMLCFKRHRKLRVLDVSGNPFGDTGVKHMATAFESEACPVLEELRMGSCIMGNDGAKALGAALGAKALPRLVSLDLRFNQNIKDPGGNHLVLACAVNGMPRLEFFCLKGHGMSGEVCMKMVRQADGLFDVVV